MRRAVVLAAALVLAALVSIQFARIAGEDLAMAHALSTVQRDIVSLKRRKAQDEREVRRLSDPQGAIPEIHDRLRLVRPNEAVIYVRRTRAVR